MKFLHIADLHIGKSLNQKSLLDDQKVVLNQIIKQMEDNDISTLLLVGDIYDKQIPSKEAVNLFNEFLCDLIMKHHYKVYIISGNHDSVERLNFASSILKSEGLFIETYATSPITKYELFDEFGKVTLYMLPFSTPLYTRTKFNTTCKTYSDMIKYYVESSNIDFNERNVLMTHHTLLHENEAKFSDSELRFNIGGTEGIDAAYFNNFDYVALGHLHCPQYLSKEYIRYSGSILKYSESEINTPKSSVMVEINEKGNVIINLLPLVPLRDLKVLKGTIEELLIDPSIIIDDFVYVILTNDKTVPYAMKRIKVKYPNAVSLTYDNILKTIEKKVIVKSVDFSDKNYLEQFNEFYNNVTEDSLNDNQINILTKLINKAVEDNETN